MASNHGNSGRTSLQARSSPEPRSPKPHRQRHADWVRAYCPGILDSAGYVPRLGGGLGEIETELGRAVEARGAYIAVSKACAAALADVEALLGELVERKQRLEDLCELAEQLEKWPQGPPRVLCGEGWHVLLYLPLQQGGQQCARPGNRYGEQVRANGGLQGGGLQPASSAGPVGTGCARLVACWWFLAGRSGG